MQERRYAVRDQLHYLLTFENCSPNEARSAAEDLEITLFQEIPNILIHWESGDPNTQDVGSILAIVLSILGTPVAVVFANTLSDWLKRRKDVTLTVRNAEREIILQNITYKEADQLIDRFARFVALEVEAPSDKEGKENHAESTE
jgi:hypothetical protein